MLVLPEEHRRLFKEPFGTLYASVDELLPLIRGKVIYSVGDIVTHNLRKKGVEPAVAVIDGHTMRSPCTRQTVHHGILIRVKNPAGTITGDLVSALEQGVRNPPATIVVDGEEDLAVIPLILIAPDGAVILYGQPHRGVVLRSVDNDARRTAQHLRDHFIQSDGP